ncbi:MAG: AAA family ATPase [Gammaproteobacteria bacterium]|nr:AAA family ATPase [Gammaproteobacteria bacterium]
MLKHIQIAGYKSLKNSEVELKPLSVFFGPNAAGKSNFLDALQLLSKLTTCKTLKEAFQPPCRGKPLESFTFGNEGISGLVREKSHRFSIRADVELSPTVVETVNRQILEMGEEGSGSLKYRANSGKIQAVRETSLRYRVEIEIFPRTGILRVADEYLAPLDKKGEPAGKPFLFRKNEKFRLCMEGRARPTCYDLYPDHTILSLPHYPPHYPHLIAMRREFESWQFFCFEPRERMRASDPVREVRHIGMMGEELAAFLNTLKTSDNKQFHALEKALHTIMPDVEGIDVEVNDLGEAELKLVEGGIPVSARVLSDGTLRILGLLALSGAGEMPALIGFEEPENGIHPRRVRLIAEMLGIRSSLAGTQYIVTTHSPLLPDLMPEESLFICRKKQGYTEIKPISEWELVRKSGMAESLDAEDELTPSERMLRGDFDA